MARTTLIAGNWKMNPATLGEAVALAAAVHEACVGGTAAEVLVIPPTAFVAAVAVALDGGAVALGAQNMHPEPRGAFTGEVAGTMLRDIGVRYVLRGHSERRQIFGESPAWVGAKVAAAHRDGLQPILCVGETLAEREAGNTEAVVMAQLTAGFEGLEQAQVAATVVAYEPVWAIGTGRTASPEQAQAVHAAVRAWLRRRVGAPAEEMRILYGGSVKPANAAALLGQPDIDGALVGGASLDASSFAAIAAAAGETASSV